MTQTIQGSSKDAKKMQVTHGSGNVFEDVGFPPEEAAFFGETQPRISNLMKGKIGRFSIDKLINMLARAGISSFPLPRF